MGTGDITSNFPLWDAEYQEIVQIRVRLDGREELSPEVKRSLEAREQELQNKVNPQWGR